MKRETVVGLFLIAALTPAAEARNPFEFGVDEKESAERDRTPRLTLILSKGERRIALIDGVPCGVGDRTVAGMVTQIGADTVVLETDEGATVTLSLGKENR